MIKEITKVLKKRGPKKGEGGRPKIIIDWEKFEFACKLMATEEEICGLLNVSDTTLYENVKRKYGKTFQEVLKQISSGTKVSLRRMQFKGAEAGNTTMLVWLGKQHLGQSDKTAVLEGTTEDHYFLNNFFGLSKRNGNGNGNGHHEDV